MLVLNRQLGEAVVLSLPDGREVRVYLVDIRHRISARIGFEAPPDVIIMRSELLTPPLSPEDGPC